MDKEDKKALENIEKYDCHVLNVMEGEGLPQFTYSVGLEKKLDTPELVIIGLKSELAHSMVNNYRDRVKKGEQFQSGRYYSDFLEGFNVCFTHVDQKHYEEYFGWCQWLYNGNKFRVMQLVWPTTDGIWPWSNNKSEYYDWAQPILNNDGCITKI